MAKPRRGNLTWLPKSGGPHGEATAKRRPNDEPASARLKRIRAERVGATMRGHPAKGQPHRVAPTTPDTSNLPELPDGWKWTTIGEACQVNPAMQWPERFTEGTPIHFVPMAAVDEVAGAIIKPVPRPISEVWRGYKRFQNNDVIFARITPCMENGKAAVATNLLNGIGLGSTEFHVLRPSENTLADWIYYFVRQQSFRNEAARAMTGTAGQLRVPADFITQAAIPLPPLSEQRRIVARIETLFAESRTARDALERIPALLKHFRQSVLASAFRGELTERDPNDEPASTLLERIRAEHVGATLRGRPQSRGTGQPHRVAPTTPDTSELPKLPEGWVWVKFDQIVDSLKNGIYKPPEAYGSGTPCLRMYNIEGGKIILKELKLMRLSKEDIKEYRLVAGDILVNRVNSRELVGKAAVIPDGLGNIVFESKNIRLRVSLELTIPGYVSYFLQTRAARDQIEIEAKQTVGMATINQSDISDWEIPLAPLAEQRRIVAKIESLFAQADAIERAVVIARQRADKVDQSILARAFRGEL